MSSKSNNSPNTSISDQKQRLSKMSHGSTTQRAEPRYFRLSPISAETATNEINTYTEDFDPKFKITEEFKIKLLETLNSRPDDETGTRRGFLNVPDCTTDDGQNIIRQVIGRGGCYFHLTTQNTGIDFIWHDRAQNKFFFWGTKYPLIRAMKIIDKRISMVTQRMESKTTP